MPCKLLLDYLDRMQADYQLHRHATAYTAQEVAHTCHIQGRSLAKAVMVKLGHELAMVVIPAHYHVQVELLAHSLGVRSVALATEREFARHFPRCELGAIPPFGHLYGVRTFLIPSFDDQSPLAFNAGSHDSLLVMSYHKYWQLAGATAIFQGAAPIGWLATHQTPSRANIVM